MVQQQQQGVFASLLGSGQKRRQVDVWVAGNLGGEALMVDLAAQLSSACRSTCWTGTAGFCEAANARI